MLREQYTVTLPVFTGPLDLLLRLIKREELDITAVALAQVTGQFLDYLRALQPDDMQAVADFLSIAARLILIKSEALLPRPPERESDEEDPGEELARQLRIYKRFQQAARALSQRDGLRTYLRLSVPKVVAPRFDLSDVTVDHLRHAMMQLLSSLPADAPDVSSVVERPHVTIRQQIRLVHQVLRTERRASFFAILKTATTRTEILITFLAILELVKRGMLVARQQHLFGDIVLEPVGDWVDEDEIAIGSEMENEPGA